jgi:hypothetical protein
MGSARQIADGVEAGRLSKNVRRLPEDYQAAIDILRDRAAANLMVVFAHITTPLFMRLMNWKMPRHLGGRSAMSLDCVPLSTYCRDAGETVEAVNKRIQRGLWKEGVHVLKVDGVKERWIDLTEVSKWARKNKDHYLSQEE